MPTMGDIAKHSGYCRATVSAVINGKGSVCEVTRRAILEVARKLGYKHPGLPEAHEGDHPGIIGVVFRNVTHPYNEMLVNGIERALADSPYRAEFFSTHENATREAEIFESLYTRNARGLILGPVSKGWSLESIWHFYQTNVPVICIEKIAALPIDYADFDNQAAGYKATEFLIKKGHEKIWYVQGSPNSVASEQRELGYKKCLLEHKKYFDYSMLVPGLDEMDQVYARLKERFAKSKDRPSAILCFNDLSAIGAYKAIYEIGLKIPGNVSVVGCDNIPMAAAMFPGLTTISFQVTEVAEYVAKALIEKIERKEPRAKRIARIFPPTLIRRESVADLNASPRTTARERKREAALA